MLAHPSLIVPLQRSLEATALTRLGSVALPEMGYYVSRSPSGEQLIVDAGAHGMANGGHAHADALSLTLSLRGLPLFIDPGTAFYTIDPASRDRFRSSALHNTVVVDGQPQSVPSGPFHWQRTANGVAETPDLSKRRGWFSRMIACTWRDSLLALPRYAMKVVPTSLERWALEPLPDRKAGMISRHEAQFESAKMRR